MTTDRYSEKWILAGGFNTRYLEAGPENGSPVVLLHDGGFGGSSDMSWSGVIPSLVDAGYRVLAPDMLGFGGTDKAYFFDRSPTEFRAVHVAAFCAALGLSGVHFVGTSFGGTLMMRALTMNPIPWPIASACSIAGTGGPWRVPEAMAKLVDFDGTEVSLGQNVISCIADPDYQGFDFNTYVKERYAQALLPGHFAALTAARLTAPWEAKGPSAQADAYPGSLKDCKVPLLLVAPSEDPTCQPNWPANIQEVMPSVQVATISGRHSPNVDRPDLVVQLLVDWLSRAKSR